MTVAAVVALGLMNHNMPLRRVAGAGVVIAILATAPEMVIPLLLIMVVLAVRHHVRSRTEAQLATRRDVAAAAELTALGLTGGLGASAALALAGRTVGGEIGGEIEALLRRARIDGFGGTVVHGQIGRVVRVLARASATGAPLLDPVSRLADELHSDLAAARLAAVRRLPVAMLFPLTLLILPGFLLLAVAPALYDAFGRLEI